MHRVVRELKMKCATIFSCTIYPRMDSGFGCGTYIDIPAWQNFIGQETFVEIKYSYMLLYAYVHC